MHNQERIWKKGKGHRKQYSLVFLSSFPPLWITFLKVSKQTIVPKMSQCRSILSNMRPWFPLVGCLEH